MGVNSHDKVRKKLFVRSRPLEWCLPLVHVRKNPSRGRRDFSWQLLLSLERGRAKCRTSFCQPSMPTRCCGACDHARITRQRRMRDVEKSIRTNGVRRARSEQKPRARFVNRIIFCDVVDAAGRRPWSRALIVYMNTGLGLATIDGVLLCGISVAAQVDRVEVLGAAY